MAARFSASVMIGDPSRLPVEMMARCMTTRLISKWAIWGAKRWCNVILDTFLKMREREEEIFQSSIKTLLPKVRNSSGGHKSCAEVVVPARGILRRGRPRISCFLLFFNKIKTRINKLREKPLRRTERGSPASERAESQSQQNANHRFLGSSPAQLKRFSASQLDWIIGARRKTNPKQSARSYKDDFIKKSLRRETRRSAGRRKNLLNHYVPREPRWPPPPLKLTSTSKSISSSSPACFVFCAAPTKISQTPRKVHLAHKHANPNRPNWPRSRQKHITKEIFSPFTFNFILIRIFVFAHRFASLFFLSLFRFRFIFVFCCRKIRNKIKKNLCRFVCGDAGRTPQNDFGLGVLPAHERSTATTSWFCPRWPWNVWFFNFVMFRKLLGGLNYAVILTHPSRACTVVKLNVKLNFSKRVA